VVFNAGMNQFVQKGVIDQFIRQSDQGDVQIDVIFSGATSPSGFLVFYEYPVVVESVFL
jgi:hypothetical protein